MGHRNLIGIQESDGSITSIYCHWGNNGNGAILAQHYTHETDVRSLLALGNVSYIDDTLENCSAYIRDWGRREDFEHAETFPDLHTWITAAPKFDCNWVWLYTNGEWVGGLIERFESTSNPELLPKATPEPVHEHA